MDAGIPKVRAGRGSDDFLLCCGHKAFDTVDVSGLNSGLLSTGHFYLFHHIVRRDMRRQMLGLGEAGGVGGGGVAGGIGGAAAGEGEAGGAGRGAGEEAWWREHAEWNQHKYVRLTASRPPAAKLSGGGPLEPSAPANSKKPFDSSPLTWACP
ncbi:unnamed protein product [Closterium sp. Yama58-4]|nr:unnamed protein product [Closterium sp. Yama58-4]